MKKLVVFITALVLCMVSNYASSEVNINIGIPLPPPIIIRGGPIEVVVIPETYVYVSPDIEVDIFFYDGWWWRHWENRWYRCRDYRRGPWEYRERCPRVVREIPPNWRFNYQHHSWGRDYTWDHKRMPQHEVDQNWKRWKNERYWDKPEHKQYYRQQEKHPQKGQGDKHRK